MQKNKPISNNKPQNAYYIKVFLTDDDTDRLGHKFDLESLNDLLIDLEATNTFKKVSIPVTIARSIALKKPMNGAINIARIVSYNETDRSFEIAIFGKNVEYAQNVLDSNVVMKPLVRTDRDTGMATSIMAFELCE